MNFKRSMISVATAAVLVASFTGCGDSDDTSTSTTSGVIQTINTPTGTVSGYVQSTNGNPIAGLTVSLLGNTTTTNDFGQYSFADIAVSNTVGADAATAHNPFTVVIGASETYLGATVLVTPVAQINDTSANTGLGDGETNPNTLFIDGFNAEAGTAVLPQLTATVKGRLQDNGTGTNVGSTTITFDFITALVSGGQAAQGAGTATSYAVETYSTNVAADGTFSIENLPNDAELNIHVASYTVNAIENDTNGAAAPATVSDFNTNGEVTTLDLGDISLTPIVQADSISPTVDVKKTASTSNELAEGIDTVAAPLVVTFNEPIDTTRFKLNNLIVATQDASGITDILAIDTAKTVFDATGTMLSIYTTTAVASGTDINVRLKKDELVDVAGNNLELGSAAATTASLATIQDDTATARLTQLAGTAASYLELTVKTYGKPATLVATIADMAQPENTTSTTLAGTNYTTTSLQGLIQSDTDGSAAVYQFNPGADNANMYDLYNALAATSAELTAMNDDPTDFHIDTARVNFTNDPEVANYVINVKSASTAVTSKAFDYNGNIINDIDLTNANRVITAADRAAGFITLDNIATATVGDIVEIYPVNGFNDLGDATRISLVDNTPLTTLLQNTAGVDGANGAGLGNAGEPISIGAGASGSYLPTFEIDNDSVKTTTKTFPQLLANATATSAYNGLIDANSVAAYSPIKTLGVKVSEAVGSTSAEILASASVVSPATDYNASITAGAYTKIGVEHFVGLTVDNTLNLQHANSITLKGLADVNGVVNNDDSIGVKIVDKLAPIMTSAITTGNTATFTFNEPLATTSLNAYYPVEIDGKFSVQIAANGTLTATNNAANAYDDATQVTAQNDKDVLAANIKLTATLSTDNKTITVVASDVTPARATANLSTLSNYFQFATYTEDSAANTDEHYVVSADAKVSFDGDNTVADADNDNGVMDATATAAADGNTQVFGTTNFADFVVADQTAPSITSIAGTIQNPAASAADKVTLLIVGAQEGGTINDTAGNVALAWESDATDGVTDTVTITFNEDVVTDSNGDSALTNADIPHVNYTMTDSAGADSVYLRGDVVVVNSKTLRFTISDASTVDRTGDYITVTGVKDLAGNAMGDIVITLNADGDGVTVSSNAIN